MKNVVELKYAIGQLKSRVGLFKQKDANSWNFRCPACGDSSKSKTKARGNIYLNNKNNYSYKCFNCSYSASAQQFLKEYYRDLYDEYRMSIFKDRKPDILNKKTLYIPEAFDKKHLQICTKNFEARAYLKSRCIPEDLWSKFYYTNKLGSFINQNRTDGKYEKFKDGHGYIINLITENRKVVGVCARVIESVDSKFRYVHAKLNDASEQMVWNLDNVDKSKPVICVEGIFDACLLPNAVALLTSTKIVKDLPNAVYLIDNEPRNKEIVKIVEKLIKNGLSIAILPEAYQKYGKDINDYVKNGLTQNQITKDIFNHTYSGPMALLEFNRWKRV